MVEIIPMPPRRTCGLKVDHEIAIHNRKRLLISPKSYYKQLNGIGYSDFSTAIAFAGNLMKIGFVCCGLGAIVLLIFDMIPPIPLNF
jgi:hypothetical protein